MAEDQAAVRARMDAATEPYSLFDEWMEAAKSAEVNDPDAMSLGTCTAAGVPSVRMVLLKRVDERGFSFYTNGESRKGGELRENPHAALCLHWKSLRRQVRVEGVVEELPGDDVDAYFASRGRRSKLGAWASQQSRPLASRAELEAGGGGFPGEVPGGGAAAALLDGLSRETGTGRVLAGWGGPSARPDGIYSGRCGWMDERAPLPLAATRLRTT